ncbi:hypothetical protein NB572_12330 [Vibrio alginolyticus]|nr:hypothetical protein [Vibrio alginolyticus]
MNETSRKNKQKKLKDLCNRFFINAESISFGGDDVFDIPMMYKCILPSPPINGYQLNNGTDDFILAKIFKKRFILYLLNHKLVLKLKKILYEKYQLLLDKIEVDDVRGLS